VKEVTKEDFYKVLMAEKRDIQPHIVNGWHNETGYTHEWRIHGGCNPPLFGVSTSGDGSGSGRGQSYKLAI
jgi:hypothetical protein